MKTVLVAIFGTSWRTTLMGFGEAVFVSVLNYVTTHQMGDTPESRQVFFGGIGLAICMVIRGRISKEEHPHPLIDNAAS